MSDVEDEVLARSLLGSWFSGISLYQAAASLQPCVYMRTQAG